MIVLLGFGLLLALCPSLLLAHCTLHIGMGLFILSHCTLRLCDFQKTFIRGHSLEYLESQKKIYFGLLKKYARISEILGKESLCFQVYTGYMCYA